jgi:hypothetical protein
VTEKLKELFMESFQKLLEDKDKQNRKIVDFES